MVSPLLQGMPLVTTDQFGGLNEADSSSSASPAGIGHVNASLEPAAGTIATPVGTVTIIVPTFTVFALPVPEDAVTVEVSVQLYVPGDAKACVAN